MGLPNTLRVVFSPILIHESLKFDPQRLIVMHAVPSAWWLDSSLDLRVATLVLGSAFPAKASEVIAQHYLSFRVNWRRTRIMHQILRTMA